MFLAIRHTSIVKEHHDVERLRHYLVTASSVPRFSSFLGDSRMRFVQHTPEEAMVAHFLLTELHSVRFGAAIRGLLEREHVDVQLIEHPDLNDPWENAKRAELLGAFRGYRRNADVFTGLPEDVQWWRAFVSWADLERIKYINDAYWIDFSGGSRLVIDAARRILAGAIPDVAAGYRSLAQAFAEGARFPELILLYNPKQSELVVLEGHVRVTAYVLSMVLAERMPAELAVLVGCSDRLNK